MNLWVKFSLFILGLVAVLASVVAGFLLWQNKNENKRILQNYGEIYLARLKEFRKFNR